MKIAEVTISSRVPAFSEVSTMEDLNKIALQLERFSTTRTAYPQFSKESDVSLQRVINGEHERKYATNNGTIAYICDFEYYVIPYDRAFIDILKHNGFGEDSFYVAFSNWDYPVYAESYWKHLKEAQRVRSQEYFVADCEAFSDEKGFGKIPQEMLKRCFKMPTKGVAVRHINFETTYFPVVNGVLDCTANKFLGHVTYNNGTVAFCYRDGATYVTKDYEIYDELIKAGYIEGGIFVPFSNGEEIQDYGMRSRWNQLCAAE